MILIEFAITGYLATTAIARFTLRNGRRHLYPFVGAGLYLLHSSIFFVLSGNSIFRKDDWIIQLGGAGVTLICTSAGNRCLLVLAVERANLKRP
jgi:hypothetical protein